MTGEGLREILNPSELLINQQPADLSGSAIAANVEGNRPLLDRGASAGQLCRIWHSPAYFHRI